MFLAVVAGHTVSPSVEVDQAWHLHLVYMQSYWREFCGEVLQQPVHHGRMGAVGADVAGTVEPMGTVVTVQPRAANRNKTSLLTSMKGQSKVIRLFLANHHPKTSGPVLKSVSTQQTEVSGSVSKLSLIHI